MPVSSIRSVLAGFAGLLILMGSITVDAALQTRNASRASAALRRESRARDALMDEVRNDIYRSSRGPNARLRARVGEALARYREHTPAREQQAVEALRRQADAFWDGLDREPGRDEGVEFARQVSALNERVLDAAEEEMEEVQARFQERVWAFSTLALALGCLLAILVVRHTHQLGAAADASFAQIVAAREDLRRLSERLLTVQEEERRSLSRELHDELGQTMSAIVLELAKLESAGAGDGALREGLVSARRLAEENVGKVRNMALLLRPAMLDELGLVPALRWHAREVTRRTGLKVKMIADELDDDLPDANRTCIYRVVQEALNNCVKHAQAREVRVVIRREAEGLSVSVQDDGVGFDPVNHKGLGLLGMLERVSGLGGRFQVDSRPGQGTVLSTYFPLEAQRCRPEEESYA